MRRSPLPVRLLLTSVLATALLPGCAPAVLRTQAGATVSVQTRLDGQEVKAGVYRRPGPQTLYTQAPAGSFVYPVLLPEGGHAQLLSVTGQRAVLPPLNGFTQVFTVVSQTPLHLDAAALSAATTVGAIGSVVQAATTGLSAGSWNVSTDVFRVSDFGRLFVESVPDGASVSLNGSAAGMTPLQLNDVETGRARISVSLPGFTTVSRSVPISAEQTSLLRVRLYPLPITTGVISVTSSVPATVSIDGQDRGSAPAAVPVSAGSHSVAVSAASGSQSLTVDVRPGAQVSVRCQGTGTDGTVTFHCSL